MSGETDAVVVFITAGTGQEADNIARVLVEGRKAACVNIVPQVHSLFWWQGEPDSAQEALLIAKTRAALLPQLIEAVKEVHSYEVPEIVALPIIDGNRDYLRWVAAETREG